MWKTSIQKYSFESFIGGVHSTCLEKLLFTKWKRIMLIVSIMLYKDRGFFAIDGRTIINIYIHAYLFIS